MFRESLRSYLLILRNLLKTKMHLKIPAYVVRPRERGHTRAESTESLYAQAGL